MAVWTWGTWLDPVIDFGRELYVPWRLLAGEVLYRDIAYFNGPFSPYCNLMWYTAFGVSLRALVLGNLIVLAGACYLLYRLLLYISDRWVATACVVVFLALFAFGQHDRVANFNWVCPYSHEMTHGVALCLLAVFGLVGYLEHGRIRSLAVSGIVTGLAFLTKVETATACIVAVLVGLGTTTRDRGAGRVARDVGLLLGMAALPFLAAVALLATAMPVEAAVRGALGGWTYAFREGLQDLKYYKVCLGIDDPWKRLDGMFFWSGVYAATLAPPFALAVTLRRALSRWRDILALGLGVWLALWLPFDRLNWNYTFTPLPLVVLIVLAAAGWRWYRTRGEAGHRASVELVLGVLALALLAKILLNARLHHYGFGLSVVGTMLGIVALLRSLPALAARLGGHAWTMRAAGLGILAALVLGKFHVYTGHFEKRTVVVGRGPDAFRADERGTEVQKALSWLDQIPPDRTLLVMPEGVLVNFLARRRNPTGHINFMPPELIMFGEDAILAALEAARPDLVLVIHRESSEYGLPLFGTDYGERLLAWVQKNYRPIDEMSWGPQPLHPKRLRDKEAGVWLCSPR